MSHIYKIRRNASILGLVCLLSIGISYRANSGIGSSRSTAALSEMKSISEAIKMAQTDTGYSVTLRALDDEKGTGSYKDRNFIQYKIQSEPTPFALNNDGSYLNGNFPYSTWKGPYITYQSICTTGNPNTISEYGSPLDPWGNPYKLFTAKGLTNPSAGESSASPFYGFTIVSYGQDGLPGTKGTQAGQGDDIVFRF